MKAKLESKAARQLIEHLRDCGLEKHVELPQIAVMGDTSSGKSSVLSAVSGIDFPSNDKLTTRCPTQLIMNSSNVFSGSISVRRYGNSKRQKIPKVSLYSLKNVACHIERITKIFVEEGQYISDDAIVIDVKGPGLPNLTLTDLPGLVQAVGDTEDEEIIPRVKALVHRYLVQDRTIILAVVPANVDMHNSSILQAAEKADPDGKRTMAVITKADLIDKGAEEGVFELLQNKKKYLRRGYHAVRCRGQIDLKKKMTIACGIKQEKIFFDTNASWSTIEKKLCGVPKLTEKLMQILEDILNSAMPHVISEISEKLTGCTEELVKIKHLPTAGDRYVFALNCFDEFCNVMNLASTGSYHMHPMFHAVGFGKANLRAWLAGKEDAFNTKILFNCVPELADEIKVKKLEKHERFQVEIGGEWKEAHVIEIYDFEIDYQVKGDTKVITSTFSNMPRIRPLGLTMKSLKEKMLSYRGEELTIFVNYPVFCALVQEYVYKWKTPMLELLTEYCNQIRSTAKQVVSYFKWPEKLVKHLLKENDNLLNELEGKVRDALNSLLERELRPHTLNHYLHDNLEKNQSASIVKALQRMGANKKGMVKKNTAIQIARSVGVGTASNEDRRALYLHQAVQAYVKVASKSFIDSAPKLINHEVLEPYLNQIKDNLRRTSQDQCDEFLKEDEEIVNRRAYLEQKRNSLLESKKVLSSY